MSPPVRAHYTECTSFPSWEVNPFPRWNAPLSLGETEPSLGETEPSRGYKEVNLVYLFNFSFSFFVLKN